MTILDRLAVHARKAPNLVAYKQIKEVGAPEEMTFSQLERRALTLGQSIREVTKPGDRALLLYGHGLEFIAAFLGCLIAGVTAVPAYPPRRNRSNERLDSIVDDCTPCLVLTTTDNRSTWHNEFVQKHRLAKYLTTDEIETTDGPFAGDAGPRGNELAFLQYTSGATGAPKGTMVTHSSLVANEISIQAAFQYSAETVMVSWLPLFHDMGLIGGVLQPLFVGFKSILMSPQLFLREPIRWLRTISDEKATTTGAPNFAYDHCASSISDVDKASLDLSTLTLAYCGAEPVRAATVDRFSNAFVSCNFNPQAFFPCYGLAEVTLFASGGPPLRSVPRIEIDAVELERRRIKPATGSACKSTILVSCGKVGAETRIAIVDPDSHCKLTPDRVGEVWITGPSVAAGYWNNHELSQKIFHANTSCDGDGPFLRTADLGFLHNGELFITGRLKDLIIVRGRNIYPQDVEAAVEEAVTFLRPNSCTAFAVDDRITDGLAIVLEASRELARQSGHVQCESSANGESIENHGACGPFDDLIQRICERVTDITDITPIRIAFVQPGTFPRTSSGKVQRHVCKQGLLQGGLSIVYDWRSSVTRHEIVGQVSMDSGSKDEVATMTDRLVTILNLWLQSQPHSLVQTVSAHTNLRSLGLDSLAISSLILEIERHVGSRLTPEALYECPTMTALGTLLVDSTSLSHPANVQNGNPKANGNGASLQPPPTTMPARAPFFQRLAINNRRQHEWRQRGEYFFESEIERQSGNWVTVDGRRMLMLASYSYLGLVGHPSVNRSASDAMRRLGTGAHGVRLLAGTSRDHRALERELAAFMRADDCIVYGSGYISNLATIAAIVGDGDFVVGDELNHASIADGCRFSGAQFKSFRHNDVDHLEYLLRDSSASHKLVVVDAVYSMDGDIAKLPQIVDVCRRHHAMLMVDEAHSIGVLGRSGRGIQEHFELPANAIDFKMGTLSKAIPSCGGFIAARRDLIDHLKHNARGFIFSAALPVPQVAAAREALHLLQSEPHRIARLRRNVKYFAEGLRRLGYRIAPTQSAIIPIIFNDEATTLRVVKYCRNADLFVVPVFYPAVPVNAPRIRATMMASHTKKEIDYALEVFERANHWKYTDSRNDTVAAMPRETLQR